MISANKVTFMWFTQSGGTNEGEALAPAIAKTATAVNPVLPPPGTARLAWRSISWKLLASVLLSLSPWSSVFAQIRAIQEGGRTVFVNDDTVASRPASHAADGNRSAYEYWSNTERRWKPLPPASSSLLRRARDAAAEVQTFAKAAPETKSASETPVATSPNSQRQAVSHRSSSAEIDSIIEEAAARHHVDPNLVRAVIKVESNFNPAAVSRKGAMGLMQLMPATARKFNVSNPFDPRQNVDAGVQHLRRLLDNFGGNVGLTLAAYNAGEGAVNRNNGIPPYSETRNYLRQFRGLYNGETSTLISSSAPIRVSRDAFGVLTITNAE